jgi:hypothetical protein
MKTAAQLPYERKKKYNGLGQSPCEIMNSAQAHTGSRDISTFDNRDKIEGCTFYRSGYYVLFIYCKELSHTEKMEQSTRHNVV